MFTPSHSLLQHVDSMDVAYYKGSLFEFSEETMTGNFNTGVQKILDSKDLNTPIVHVGYNIMISSRQCHQNNS